MSDVEHEAIKRWSTWDVPQKSRLDYFAAALSEAAYPLGVDDADPRTFHAEVSIARLGAIGVAKTIGSPNRAFRGRSELARSSDHSFNLLTTLQASWTVDHRGRLTMSPHDVLLFDSEYPLETDVRDPFIAINVSISEAWLRQWIPNPNVLTAQRIPGKSLWGIALSTYLGELSPDLVAAPPLPLSVMADQVGSLLVLTASALRDATLAYTPTVRSLHDRIKDCLRQRCTEPQLTAVEVAASLNISVRTLHRTLAAANETFGSKLIEARARVALRMLASPSFNRLTTAEIGRRAGFLGASHFARVMRDKTGQTPLHLRRAASEKVPEAEDQN
jgi:AraC-like DNA-binding protein